ncbi:MAG: RsmD family RNA methyltransferase [Clostridia bacterium]
MALIGIEALSRGAAYAAFIESEEEALSCIRQNLKALDFQNQGGAYRT